MEGPVLVEVEALLKCRNSVLKMNYRFYREDTAVDLRMTLWFCEKDRMVKFHLPLAFSGSFLGQTAYGAEEIAANGQEAVRQKWVAFKGTAQALGALNNGTYGLDCEGQELHLTLIRGGGGLRGPSHCGASPAGPGPADSPYGSGTAGVFLPPVWRSCGNGHEGHRTAGPFGQRRTLCAADVSRWREGSAAKPGGAWRGRGLREPDRM